MMPLVRLVSWNRDLAQQRARALRKAGFTVNAEPLSTTRLIGQFRAISPAAVLIDLDRLPSHGHGVAAVLRNGKSTRYIPIVFAGGAVEKVERIRRELPDAVFAGWETVARALQKAIQNAPAEPIQPAPYMAQYAGSPLVKKLGLKPNMKVALMAAPEGFEETLGDLPDGIAFHANLSARTDLALCFVRSSNELEAALDTATARLPERCPIWIIHPKQSGRYRVDFNQRDVRAVALAAGLVDYKVCAIDADWSGLKFARRGGNPKPQR